jgi:hypothetical protein
MDDIIELDNGHYSDMDRCSYTLHNCTIIIIVETYTRVDCTVYTCTHMHMYTCTDRVEFVKFIVSYYNL